MSDLIAEWVTPPAQRYGSFRLDGNGTNGANGGDINDLALAHYNAAPMPAAGDPKRRLASFLHVGGFSADIDLQPTAEGWNFHAYRLGKTVKLDKLATATRAVLEGTDPSLDPVYKGVKVASQHADLHANQTSLLGNFNDSVIYEDDEVLAIDKPTDVSAHWDPEHHIGANEIAQRWRGDKIAAVHRLDRLTSGVLLFAKDKAASRILSNQFAREADFRPRKIYIAIVKGEFGLDRSIRGFLNVNSERVDVSARATAASKFAKTVVTNLAAYRAAGGAIQSVLGVQILTGRKHQIRTSLAAIDWPIVGDPIYNGQPPDGRLRLHARSLTVRHPKSRQPINIEAPIPNDFLADAKPADRTAIMQAISAFEGYN